MPQGCTHGLILEIKTDENSCGRNLETAKAQLDPTLAFVGWIVFSAVEQSLLPEWALDGSAAR
jgi:hypothetical protein